MKEVDHRSSLHGAFTPQSPTKLKVLVGPTLFKGKIFVYKRKEKFLRVLYHGPAGNISLKMALAADQFLAKYCRIRAS
jgi:hypothetical protein